MSGASSKEQKTAKEALQVVGFGGISKPGIKMKCALSEKGGKIVGAARFSMHRTQKSKREEQKSFSELIPHPSFDKC